jgi:hypothetical protein
MQVKLIFTLMLPLCLFQITANAYEENFCKDRGGDIADINYINDYQATGHTGQYDSNFRSYSCTICANGEYANELFKGSDRKREPSEKDHQGRVSKKQIANLKESITQANTDSQEVDEKLDVDNHTNAMKSAHARQYNLSVKNTTSPSDEWIHLEYATLYETENVKSESAKATSDLVAQICGVGHARSLWMSQKGFKVGYFMGIGAE